MSSGSITQPVRRFPKLVLRSLRVSGRRVEILVTKDLCQTHEIILVRPVQKLCAVLTRRNSGFGSNVTISSCRPGGGVVPLSMELNLDLDGLKPKNAATRASRAQVSFAKKTAVSVCTRQAARHRYDFNTPPSRVSQTTSFRRIVREALAATRIPAAGNLVQNAADQSCTTLGILC